MLAEARTTSVPTDAARSPRVRQKRQKKVHAAVMWASSESSLSIATDLTVSGAKVEGRPQR